MSTDTFIFDTHLETFELEVLQASEATPVLVDFWAAWCAPCIAIEPVLGSAVANYNGQLRLARLEVDEGDNMKLAGQYHVRGFPTIILFQNQNELGRFSGMQPASAIHSFIERHTQLEPAP